MCKAIAVDGVAMNPELASRMRARLNLMLEQEQPFRLKDAIRQIVFEHERKVILETLRASNWSVRGAARTLNVSHRTLLYKIRQLALLSNQPSS